MKKLLFAVVFVFIGTGVFAQVPAGIEAENYEKIFLFSLRNQNEGVVTGMLFNMALLNISGQRELISNNVLKELEFLRINGNSDVVKEMAGLTADFINSENPSVKLKVKYDYHDSDKFFKILKSVMEEENQNIAKSN